MATNCSSIEQMRKLFLGGLISSVTEEELKEYCSSFGTVTECLIMRDREGHSRGFAFVSFQDRTMAEEFIKNRPHSLDGRKIDVKRAMPREETSKFDGILTVNKIFIGALGETLTENDLKEYFQRFGNLTECHIMKDKEEKSRGFAFITFDDYDAVDRCILEKPHSIHGKDLDVRKAIPRDQASRSYSSISTDYSQPMPLMNSATTVVLPSPTFFPYQFYTPVPTKKKPIETHRSRVTNDEQNRKLFIGGLSMKTSDETLRDYVQQFGAITDCLVMKDQNGQSKCFGFVTFSDPKSIDEFMKKRPHHIDGRQIDPKRAMPREEAHNDDIHLTVKKIFLGGIRDGLDEKALRTYFEPYGTIVDCLLMLDKEGKTRGFAFIEFDDYDAVDKVILARPHTIGEHRIDVKKAIPKDQRHHHHQQQQQQHQQYALPMPIAPGYYPYNPFFIPSLYSPSAPLITAFNPTSYLNESFSHLHLSNIRSSVPRRSQ